MKKQLENIKKQARSEAMKTGLVILGAVGGVFLSKGIRKLTANHPKLDAITKYALPFVLGGGGFVLAAATDEKSKAKYLGYGLTVAGVIEGIVVFTGNKDILFGILGETEIPAANAFYTESTERQNIMSGFGLSSLPVGNATLQEAPTTETRLPELEGATDNDTQDLGFNISATEDVDDKLNGII